MSVLNELYTISDLPEELLFNVSQFGQVTPGLTAEYILREVNLLQRGRLLSQGRLFDWAKEFTLEYLRATDSLYRQIGSILKEIPPESLNNVRLVMDELTINANALTDRQIGRILEASDRVNVPTRVITTYGTMPSTEYREITIPVTVTNLFGSQEQILNAAYLAHPRTTTDKPENRGYYYDQYYSMTTRKSPGIDTRHDYPWLLATINRVSLPQAFPRWFPRQTGLRPTSIYVPSDLEIVRAILRLNPRYDLGDLLNWLRARDEVCSRVSSTNIYELITQGVLQAIQVNNTRGITSLIFYLRAQSQRRAFMDYINSIGFQAEPGLVNPALEVSISTRYRDTDRVNQLNSLVDDFLGSRMCLMQYLPRYRWDRPL